MKLTLPFPPSSNRYWRTTVRGGWPHTYVSQEARQYRALAYWQARQRGAQPLDGEIRIKGVLYFPDRRGDLSNRIKVLEDALQGACYHDDKQLVELHWFRAIDKQNPRVEIEILEAK